MSQFVNNIAMKFQRPHYFSEVHLSDKNISNVVTTRREETDSGKSKTVASNLEYVFIVTERSRLGSHGK